VSTSEVTDILPVKSLSAVKRDVQRRKEQKLHRELDRKFGKTIIYWKELSSLMSELNELLSSFIEYGENTTTLIRDIKPADSLAESTLKAFLSDVISYTGEMRNINSEIKSGVVTYADLPVFYDLAARIKTLEERITLTTQPLMNIINDSLNLTA
jgi:hypothetical protein